MNLRDIIKVEPELREIFIKALQGFVDELQTMEQDVKSQYRHNQSQTERKAAYRRSSKLINQLIDDGCTLPAAIDQSHDLVSGFLSRAEIEWHWQDVGAKVRKKYRVVKRDKRILELYRLAFSSKQIADTIKAEGLSDYIRPYYVTSTIKRLDELVKESAFDPIKMRPPIHVANDHR